MGTLQFDELPLDRGAVLLQRGAGELEARAGILQFGEGKLEARAGIFQFGAGELEAHAGIFQFGAGNLEASALNCADEMAVPEGVLIGTPLAGTRGG